MDISFPFNFHKRGIPYSKYIDEWTPSQIRDLIRNLELLIDWKEEEVA